MLAKNVDLVLQGLNPGDVVLDVGGWACPFNRAQWVLDAQPFETRGFYGTFGGAPSQGGTEERFTRDTCVQRDICARDPWPFSEKQFDFVICSHTLEDIRDPLWVCSEMMRVAKRGYIEVPSRVWESCRGIEAPELAGLSHHRWLIDIQGNSMRFLQKYHLIHRWQFSLPAAFGRTLTPEASVQWLWWDGLFETSEVTIHGLKEQEAELERFVNAIRPHPSWQRVLDSAARRVQGLARRVQGKLTRMIFRSA